MNRKKFQCPSCRRVFEIPAGVHPHICPTCVTAAIDDWSPARGFWNSVRDAIRCYPVTAICVQLLAGVITVAGITGYYREKLTRVSVATKTAAVATKTPQDSHKNPPVAIEKPVPAPEPIVVAAQRPITNMADPVSRHEKMLEWGQSLRGLKRFNTDFSIVDENQQLKESDLAPAVEQMAKSCGISIGPSEERDALFRVMISVTKLDDADNFTVTIDVMEAAGIRIDKEPVVVGAVTWYSEQRQGYAKRNETTTQIVASLEECLSEFTADWWRANRAP